MMAWYSRSRACLAEPPAESPSTRNNSVCCKSVLVQSASLPGRAGPLVSFFRSTFFPCRKRAIAAAMTTCAMRSASATLLFSQMENASCVTPETNADASREVSRSLVCPVNCGSLMRSDRM